MATDKRNCVILARVSSKAQEDEGYSLDAQFKLLSSYCEKNELVVVKVFKIAETASKEQSRRVFHELIKFLDKNDVQHLIVEKTDRFARNFKDAVTIDEWLEQDESRCLHAVKENLLLHKNAKSDVKFMWNIHMSVAKKYTDNLREEAMKGWAEKLAQGWLPAVPPPGYQTITDNGKRIHVPDPKTRNIMQVAFKHYLEPQHSITSITEELRRAGLRSRKGRPYVKSYVQKLLNNPFYIGINHFDGQDYPGKQEPIISKQVFYAVQAKMHKGRPPVQRQHNPLFKNLISCETCGGMITWQLQKGRFYGYCQRTEMVCKGSKALREDQIEELIAAKLNGLVCPSPEIITWVIQSLREQQQASDDTREQKAQALQTHIDRVTRMDSELYDDKLAGEISKEAYALKHAQFKEQLNELHDELANVDRNVFDGAEQRVVLLELSQKAAELFRTRSITQKRIVITKLFSSITSNNGFVSVKYTKFAEVVAKKTLQTKEILGR